MSLADKVIATAFGRTAYLERGAGQAVILVHGVGLHCGVWEPQIEALAQSSRVVAYDTFGHGLSDRPPAGVTLEHYLEQLRSVADELRISSAVIIGHSMGAMIATAFAAAYPERTDGLIAFNAVFRRSAEEVAQVLKRAEALEVDGPGATIDAAIDRWFGPELGPADLEKAKTLRSWLLSADPEGYAAAYRVFATSDGLLASRLSRLDAPALFVTGEQDPNSKPSMSVALSEACPNGRVRILAGERHMPTFKNPRLTNAIIQEFLEECRMRNPT